MRGMATIRDKMGHLDYAGPIGGTYVNFPFLRVRRETGKE
jgi:hypothetical protein